MSEKPTSSKTEFIWDHYDAENGFVIVQDSDWRENKSIEDLLAVAWNNQFFNDTEIVFGNYSRILCSKFILKLRSKYFDDILDGEWTDVITLPNENSNHFRMVLEYMYTDKVEITHENVLGIRSIANRFKIAGLPDVVSCTRLFDCELTEDNAISLYQLAKVLKDDKFRDRALAFILRNLNAVVHSKDFLNITSDNLCELLARDDLEIRENRLFMRMAKWGEKNGVLSSETLEKPLKLTRYTGMGSPIDYSYVLALRAAEIHPSTLNQKIRNNPDGLSLTTEIDFSNAVKYLNVAMASNHRASAIKAFDFIINNATTIFAREEFTTLNLEYLRKIVRTDRLMVNSELEVFQAVKKWSIVECKRLLIEFTPQNMRKVLGKSLLHIRFGRIDSDDFRVHVIQGCPDLLTVKEIINVLLYYMYTPPKRAQKASTFLFSIKQRKGYAHDTVKFLPNEPNQLAVSDFSAPNGTIKFPYSHWIPSIKKEFDANHFWRAFTVDRAISVISFGFYGPSQDNNKVQVEISLREMPNKKILKEPGLLIAKRIQIIKQLKEKRIFHVEFYQPVTLKPNIAYVAGYALKKTEMFAHHTEEVEYEPSSLISVDLNSGGKANFNILNDKNSSVSIIRVTVSGSQDHFYAQLPEMNFVPV